MSDRDLDRLNDSGLPAAADEAVAQAAAPSPGASRSGEDSRRRGWFWHWNAIVTQFAPLIGLQGVGLLNSYTVWTDRREASPHRGYAFPSQQREADFYGVERTQLIVINKILVALDLIEIRKEMVLRTDEKGRRWRVPHNFYRVKDKGDDCNLNVDDVRRVVALAEKDNAVYRHMHHVFSDRFAPIDPGNVWQEILQVVRLEPAWIRLAERTAKEESRASARTRAGHSARKQPLRNDDNRDNPTTPLALNDSDDGDMTNAVDTIVATTNNGLQIAVDPGNNGLSAQKSTAVAPANAASQTSVVPTNTTYYQDETTTTTTVQPNFRHLIQGDNLTGVGPGNRLAAYDAGGEATALRVFADANGREPTRVEQTLLTDLATQLDSAAKQTDPLNGSGWAWVTAAIVEAVDAGSSYVAPKRVREILLRWERDGFRSERGRTRASGAAALPKRFEVAENEVAEFRLPHGFTNHQCWAESTRLLAAVIDAEQLAALLQGTAITGFQRDEVEILVPTAAQAGRLSGEYRELVTRKVSEAMRRRVRLAFLTPVVAAESDYETDVVIDLAMIGEEEPALGFIISECGLPSGQVWRAITGEITSDRSPATQELAGWLRGSTLVGRGDHDAVIVAAANPVARQRMAERYLPVLEAAVERVLGRRVPVEVVTADPWRGEQQHLARPMDQDDSGLVAG